MLKLLARIVIRMMSLQALHRIVIPAINRTMNTTVSLAQIVRLAILRMIGMRAEIDHNLFAFKLDGAHAQVRCEECHQNGVIQRYAFNLCFLSC